MKRYALSIAIMVLCACAAQAEMWMPGVFSDNMVLQRGKPVPVWGWANPGDNVTVEFGGQKKSAKVDETGKWMVRLDALKSSSEGRAFVVKGKKSRLAFENVLVGEVWLCSGQSNMEWLVRQSEGAGEASERAKNYDRIRFLTVPRTATALPVRDIDAGWVRCNPDTVQEFSGVAFYFGERLHMELDVPIGLIAASWGGSGIRAWMPPESFSMFTYTEEEAAIAAKADVEYREALKKIDMDVYRKWADEADAAQTAGAAVPEFPPLQDVVPRGKKQSSMFNGMIAPLIPYAMRGVIWYQGESNGADGMGYRDMTEAMLTAWRNRWGGEAFPFYYVQICTYYWYGTDYHLLDMWEAQAACLKIPNTGMVGTSGISQPWTWHPLNKFDVGNRLALWAMAKDYPSTQLRTGGQAKDLVYSGPMYKSVAFDGNKAIVTFDHAGEGLKSFDGKPLTHFMLSGEDKVFYNAEARIDGDQVILTAKAVDRPVAARCGWAHTSEPNLGNSAGLPVINFRTDDWKNIISSPRLGAWYTWAGEWSKKDGVFSQTSDGMWNRMRQGYKPWTDYTLECEFRRTSAGGTVHIYFRESPDKKYTLKWGDPTMELTASGGGTNSGKVSVPFKTDQWYALKIAVQGKTTEVFVDGKSVLTHTDGKDNAPAWGGIGLGGWKSTSQWRNIRVTGPSGEVLVSEEK